MSPRDGKPLRLYISAAEESIGAALTQINEDGKEQAVYYLSRVLQGPEVQYTVIEKMCLYLSFAATKLRHYLLPRQTFVIAKDFIKYMLTRPFVERPDW